MLIRPLTRRAEDRDFKRLNRNATLKHDSLVPEVRGDPITETPQLGTELVQQRQVPQRRVDHQASALPWPSMVAMSVQQRFKDLLFHSWMAAHLLPWVTNFVAVRGTGKYLQLRLSNTAEQCNAAISYLFLQVLHGVSSGPVCVRKE